MSTVRDVAKLAGVSPGTVSRVFNGNVQVSQSTKEKVLLAAAELKYTPNFLARSLKMNETRTVGLVVPDIGSEGFLETIKSIEIECYLKGYSLIVCNSDEDPDRELFHIKALLHRRIDGLILCPVTKNVEQYHDLLHQNKPIVIVDRMINGIEADVVKGNDYRGCYDATKYLLELGHRKIGVVSKPEIVPFVEERIQGYKDALKDFGVPFDHRLVQYSSHLPAEAMKKCHTLLHEQKPTAVFSMSHSLTMPLLKVLKKLQIEIPNDISIIVYGNSGWNAMLQPPLTSVACDGTEIGKMATEKLLNRIAEKTTNPQRVLSYFEKVILPVTLRERESCKMLND